MGSGLGKLTFEEEERVVPLKGTPAKSFPVLFDPRSPSEEINRTPIRVLDKDNSPTRAHVTAFDPRSPSLGVERTPILLEDRSIELHPDLNESLVLKETSTMTLRPTTPPAVQRSPETPELCAEMSPIPHLNLSASETPSSSPSPKPKHNESEQINEDPRTPVAPNEPNVMESLIQTPVVPMSNLNSNVKRPNTENAKRNLRTIVLDKENTTLASKHVKNATPSQKRTPLGHVSANSPALMRPRIIR